MNQLMLDYPATEEAPVGCDVEVSATDAESKKQVTYCTVKFTVGWLPGSVAFTDQAKSALAAARGTDKHAIRGSYAILGASRDPIIKQGAALKRLLITTRDEYTIPEYTLRSTASGHAGVPEKVKGSYLIESCKIEEFLTRFEEIKLQYLAWGQRVSADENYQKIRAADQIALSKDWEVVASRYPSARQMADSISCDTPKIEPYDASFTLADVAPETSRRLREQAEARLAASVEGATAELVLEFKSMVEAVARNCGKRVRLLPPVDVTGPMADKQDLRHAEVIQILRHSDDPEIGEGMLLVTVQRVKEKDNNAGKYLNVGKAHELLLSEDEYKALHPYETDEHRQLTQSGFDNVLWLAKKIATVKGMLGNDCAVDDLTTLAKEVESTLGELGNSAANITKQLKNSNFARNAAKKAFTGFFERLQTQEQEIKTHQRIRRKVKVGGGNAR